MDARPAKAGNALVDLSYKSEANGLPAPKGVKMNRLSRCLAVLVSCLIPHVSFSQTPGSQRPTPPLWVVRSNQNAEVLLKVFARFSPEGAAQIGVEGLDEEIVDLKPGVQERGRRASQEAAEDLKKRLGVEKDPLVRQDLEILVKAAEFFVRGSELREKYDVPYYNVVQTVFLGIRGLLDDQVPEARRKSALVRLRRYAGMEPGYTPITVLARERTMERLLKPGLLGPIKGEVEKNLGNTGFFLAGISQLLAKYKLEGYQETYAKLKEQMEAYDAFLRSEILPRARTDFRLPAEQYAHALQQNGVDIPPAELSAKAHVAFRELQGQMQELAPRVAKAHELAATDYRDVIHELKKNQLVGESILPHYQQRLKDIEDIILRESLVTLPKRPARIRLASEAESANLPAPNMRPPRLLGNTGEMGEFVLPLNIPAPPGSKEALQKFDDFTFSAASWTLTAHEARPGHELQFAAVIEKGVSTARAVFAFNSTNVEGWGLYAESITQPYMPPEGQLISLQHRLMRAARAFLDPELQSGKVTPEAAKRLLMQDVLVSDAMSTQEVERYTFRSPGQAPTYFYGYTRLVELRSDVEKALGPKFNQKEFHDFILSQGLLPPALLRKVVLDEFVGPRTRPPAR